MRGTIYVATFNYFCNAQPFFIFIVVIIFIIIIIIIMNSIISGSSSSNSTSRSIIMIIIIISSSSSSINKPVALTISTSIFELFICFLLFYINITHHCFLRDHNGNKTTQLFCVIPAIVPYGELF